jgi:ubiquitin-like 1-activating enzyme E1 B
VFQILKAKMDYNQKKKMNQLSTDETKLNIKECCSYLDIIRHQTRNGLLISSAKLEEPNPNCFVCKNAIIPLSLNITKWNLQDFIQKILKNDLGFQEPTISLEDDIIWEEGDNADIESYRINLHKHLTQLPCGGIKNGTTISIEDFSQDLSIMISIQHVEQWESSNENGDNNNDDDEIDDHKFVIGGKKPTVSSDSNNKVAATTAAVTDNKEQSPEDDDDDDGIEIIDSTVGMEVPSTDTPNISNNSDKRPIEEVEEADDADDKKPPASKRARLQPESSTISEVEVIEID